MNILVALMQELPTKEEEEIKSIESLGKQKLKRGRPARSKVKKASKYIIFFLTLLLW